MSANAPREFVDTNILVYAFDLSAGARCEVASELLHRLWSEGSGCLSVQVLQEFFMTITRKVPIPLSVEEASERIREFSTWRIFSPVPEDVLAAIALHKEARLQFWDAMVVHAASELGCDALWTEDLNGGQTIRGVLVRNPFTKNAE